MKDASFEEVYQMIYATENVLLFENKKELHALFTFSFDFIPSKISY